MFTDITAAKLALFSFHLNNQSHEYVKLMTFS